MKQDDVVMRTSCGFMEDCRVVRVQDHGNTLGPNMSSQIRPGQGPRVPMQDSFGVQLGRQEQPTRVFNLLNLKDFTSYFPP